MFGEIQKLSRVSGETAYHMVIRCSVLSSVRISHCLTAHTYKQARETWYRLVLADSFAAVTYQRLTIKRTVFTMQWLPGLCSAFSEVSSVKEENMQTWRWHEVGKGLKMCWKIKSKFKMLKKRFGEKTKLTNKQQQQKPPCMLLY